MGGGKRLAGGKSRRKPDLSQFSKWMIADIRPLLWIVTVGGLALNRSTYELSWQAKSQSLSGREFQILEMLMERPGFVVTTNQLLSHVWGWDSDVDCSVVWVHISNIRKKLARLGAPAGIRFLRGAGYVLEVAQ